MDGKVWVVVHRTCDGTIEAQVFENQADAQSFMWIPLKLRLFPAARKILL